MKKLLTFLLIPALALAAFSCKPEDRYEEYAKPTDVSNPHPVYDVNMDLGTLSSLTDFPVGVAFTKSEYFNNDSVKVIIAREFDAVTFGNEMKHDAIVGNNGKLAFATADEMVGYANEMGVDLYGHVLGWHQQTNHTYLNKLVDKAVTVENSETILTNNWNFSSGDFTGYTASGFEIVNLVSNPLEVFSGYYAAKASSDNATLQFSVGVEEGKAYAVSFWAYVDGEGTVTLESGDGQSASTSVGSEWTKYTVVLKTNSIGEYSYKLTASSGVCIDAFRVIETTVAEEPTTGGSYINPYSIGALDFEDYTLGSKGGDLVSNYSWTQFNGADYGTVTDEYHNSGSQCLKLANADGHCSNAWDIQAITPTFDVTAGTTYRIAWYSRASEEADLQIDIREDGDAKAYKNSAWGNYDKCGTSWTYQYYDYTVEAGSTLSIAFYGGTAAVDYYIDDIQVFEPKYEGDYTNYLDSNNLLLDGDFELGTNGNWSTWTSYGEIISRNDPEEGSNAAYVHSALYALKIDNTAGEYSGGDAWKAQWTNKYEIEVTGGTSYRIGLWAYSPDGYETVQIEAAWDSGTNYRQISGITDQWGFVYLDIVAPDDATTLQIKIDGFYSVGTVYIDDVQVYVTPVDSYIESNAIGSDDFESYSDGATGSDLVSAGFTQCNGASYVTVTSAEAHSGKLSMKMSNADGHCSNAWDIQVITPAYDVTAGQTYRIAWYSKATEEADLQIDIREDGDAKAYKSSAWGNYDKCGTDWTYQYYDYTVEAGSTLSVAFYGGVAAVDYYIDDIQVFQPSTTTTALRAARGYGKYPTWTRPAPSSSTRVKLCASPSFETSTSLEGETVEDAICNAQKKFVYGMIEHFDCYGWDVINEAFDESGNFRSSENTTNDGSLFIWGDYYENGGEEWMDNAFIFATKALEKYGKSADLYINDYNLETSSSKREAFCKYASENDYVTGVASQMHLSLLDYSLETLQEYVKASLTDLVATGKKVRISELDIACNGESDPEQATLFIYIFDQYNTIVPDAQKGGITIWGINDKDSWIGESKYPLLWQKKNYVKKNSYIELYKYLCTQKGIDYNIYDD